MRATTRTKMSDGIGCQLPIPLPPTVTVRPEVSILRITGLMVMLALALVTACSAQQNPITNGGFEVLDDEGSPVDWQLMGDCRITEDAHSGKYAMLLQRSEEEGLCGLNRVWEEDSGEQGTMLSQLKGGVRFWYKAEEGEGPNDLIFYVIPMSADPVENTGEQRARFTIPPQHVGDGQWHEGLLKYDFTGEPKVKWVHISPRLRGEAAKLLLDDISWVERVGPIPTFTKATMEEVEGKEGDECLVKATVENTGDQPIEIGIASIDLPQGLTPEGGPMRNVQALEPDDRAHLSWRVTGRRSDKGRIGISFTAGDRKALTTIEYAPVLEVVGLSTQEFIIAPEQPSRVTLRLRNAGHAMVRGVTADIRPGVPLSTPAEKRKQSLELIAPQTEASIGWEVSAESQSPSAVVRATVSAQNADDGRAQTTLIVGPPLPTAELETPGAGVLTTDAYADIHNDRVRLLFPKADFGYGIAILQRKVEGRWQTVGKLPRVSRLVVQTAGDKQAEHLVYAQEAQEIPSPEAVAPEMLTRKLALSAKLTDANGVNWAITQVVTLLPGADMFGIELGAVPDRRARLLALEGPMVYAGEGAPEGTRRLDAIFPGLEWLVEGEESSNTLDIAPDHPHCIRYVPHPHMVTIPLMSVRLAPPDGPGAVVSLLWDHLRPYYGKLDRPSAVFASPDRFEGHAASLMGLFAPSMPEYIEPNERVAKTPLEVAPNEPVRLAAVILARDAKPGDTALEAVKAWFGLNRVPEPNPLPHGATWRDEIEFSMAAYLGALWEEEDEAWWGSLHGPAIWHKTGRPPAYLYDMRMCLEACDDGEVKRRVRERYDRVIELSQLQPVADDAGFHFAGPADRLLGQADGVAAQIRQQGEDGSWRFSARIETSGVFKGKDYSELGPDNAAEVGTCARRAWEVLRFARMTGDKDARKAGLKALAFMDQFEVPRAAQVWEVPVHTPDILASSDACEAYLEGYLITGDKKYLDKAVYWAWTGLPFLYMWDVEGFEYLKYASIPVFGATWFRGSWFGRPVQWNGMRYAYALMQLAEHDDSLDWAKVARGVTVSCMYQQSTDEEDEALWPDSIDAIDKRKSGWIFSPRAILKNVYAEMGMTPTPVTATARVGLDDIHICAAGKISDAKFDVGTVSCKATYTPPQTGYAVICNISKPTRVRDNGEVAREVILPRKAQAPAWRYIDYAGILEVRLKGSKEHTLEVSGVTFVQKGFQAPIAEKLVFNFDTDTEGWRPAHHLSVFSVESGVLRSATTGVDPYMTRSNCEIPAESVKQLRIRMALDAGLSPGAQFFWTTSDAPGMDEPKSQRFEVIADGQFHDYLVPIGGHELWNGVVTAIRLDPTGGENLGTVSIDFIRGE